MTDDPMVGATAALIDVTIYQPTTGRVQGYARCVDVGLEAAYPGLAIKRGVRLDPHARYVDVATGEPQDRPTVAVTIDKTAIAADGADTATITGVPIGAMVTIGGETHAVDDGVIELQTLFVGRHRLVIDPFPAQEIVVAIDAH